MWTKSARFRTASPPNGEAVYRLVVEYDGTDFSGFQFQPGLRTVAGELEAALSRLFDCDVKVTVAGRTDAGVHAVGQVISFASHDRFPIERLGIALNSALPPDLSARDAALAPPAFSARLSARERRYTYVVLHRAEPSAVLRRFSHHEYRELDLGRMQRAAKHALGTHDFVSFCGVLPDRGGTVRTLRSVEIERAGDLIRFHYAGDGFLHRMVRILTGTLLEIGNARRSEDALAGILEARDRRAAGLTAPAQGLFLVEVVYDDFTSRPLHGSALSPVLA